MNSNQMLENVNKILEEEGNELTQEYSTPSEILEKLILPGLANSKSTLAALYKYSVPQKQGILGRIKYFILLRLRNIVLNVVERESMKQQKFNELMYKAIEQLIEENKTLRVNSKIKAQDSK